MRHLEDEALIQGRKGGGGKQHTPVEDPDDLLSTAKLKMLVAVAEGEIQGDLTAQKIFLNDTPLANDDGSYNFTGVKWDFRPGTQDQTYIQGLPETNNELSANVTVTTSAPWTRQFTNLMLDAVRIKLSLSVLPAPKNILLTETDHIEQGLTVATMNASWERVDGAIRYQAQWRKDNGDWINVPVTSAQGFAVQGIYTGSYDVRVRALNAQESGSPWGYADTTYLTGKTGKPGTPQSLLASDDVVWAIDITWAFPDGTGDTAYTELQRATTDDKANPQLLALVPYPATHYQHGPMRAGVSQWYRARLVDRIGNTGDWTTWVAGQSSSNAGDYLDMIGDTLEQTDGYKNLVSDIADLSDDIQSARDDISKVTTESAATKAGLAQEVTDRKKAITDEATARAQALLTEKNERVADISNVNQTIQTTTESLAQQIGQISAGTGSQFDPAKIWYFDSTVEGWTGNGTPTIVDGWIRPANHATDPWVQSPGSLGVNPSSYRFVKMRIRKFGAPGWAGQLRWRGTGGFNDTNMVTVAEPAYDANGIATLEFDNIPWLTEATMNQFRLDLSTKQDATNYFLIDWVALGRPTPGAGMAALQAETTARVQGDQAEATARETLAAQIRGG